MTRTELFLKGYMGKKAASSTVINTSVVNPDKKDIKKDLEARLKKAQVPEVSKKSDKQ